MVKNVKRDVVLLGLTASAVSLGLWLVIDRAPLGCGLLGGALAAPLALAARDYANDPPC